MNDRNARLPLRSIASACSRQTRSSPFRAAWYDLSVQLHCHWMSTAPVSCIIKSFNRDISWRMGATWSALQRPRSTFFANQLLCAYDIHLPNNYKHLLFKTHRNCDGRRHTREITTKQKKHIIQSI